jgi:hypothetical protein
MKATNKITAQEVTVALDELRQVIGGDIHLDEGGSCLLAYNDSLPLAIQYIEDDGRLVLAAELKSGLEDASDSEWMQLLCIDYLGIRARGCALSPDKSAGCVTIWRDVNASPLGGQVLAEELESFIDEVLAVREFIANPEFESPSEQAALPMMGGRA